MTSCFGGLYYGGGLNGNRRYRGNGQCHRGADESGFTIINNTGGTVTPTAGETYGHWVADARM